MSFPSLERAMYFSFALIAITVHVDPLQLIPLLFSVTVGMPVVSVTSTLTEVPEQTGIRWAASPREPGSMMCPWMILASFKLLSGL